MKIHSNSENSLLTESSPSYNAQYTFGEIGWMYWAYCHAIMHLESNKHWKNNAPFDISTKIAFLLISSVIVTFFATNTHHFPRPHTPQHPNDSFLESPTGSHLQHSHRPEPTICNGRFLDWITYTAHISATERPQIPMPRNWPSGSERSKIKIIWT